MVLYDLAGGAKLCTARPRVLSNFIGSGNNGETQTSGNLLFEDGDALDPGRPTAFVAVVCRAKDRTEPFVVERTLEGDGQTAFEPVRMDLGADRCGQTRDVVSRGVLGPGAYVYRIRVVDGETELASAQRRFVVRNAVAP